MPDSIYLIQGDDSLVEMTEHTYDSEDLLQRLLAQYPNLLAGNQIDSAEPRRWLLVSREVPLASEEEGGGRWSVDHLFLDQDAVPTIVEVKRSTDTRIRREVVGQMLDYAANAVVYWPVESLRARFEGACASEGLEADEVVEEFLGFDADGEEFWQNAKTNLQAGKVRLVFVADEIPAELRRVVEFLNQQMDPAEVLAVEVKQYTTQGDMKALVPRVIGQTAEAQQKKSAGTREGSRWDEISFMRDLETRRGADQTRVAKEILQWAKRNQLYIWWGRGKQDGSFFPMLEHEETWHWLFSVWTYGRTEIQFQMMQGRAPYDAESRRLELLDRLNELPGVNISADKIAKRPSISLGLLEDDTAVKQFLNIFDRVIEEIKRT
jgi:hypothetical protein